MMPADEVEVFDRLEELVREVPLPVTTAAEDARRGQRRQRRRHVAIVVTAAAAVAVVVSTVALVVGPSDTDPAPAPPLPTETTADPTPAIDLQDLTKHQQDQLFARTVDDFAAVLQAQLDPAGDGLHVTPSGDPVAIGSKGRFDSVFGRRYERAPWSSVKLLTGRYRWQLSDGPSGVAQVTVGDRSYLPCVELEGHSTEWGWQCHTVTDDDANLALIGTCDADGPGSWMACGNGGVTDLLAVSPRRAHFVGASVDRKDGLAVTVILATQGTDAKPDVTEAALVAAAEDRTLTLAWGHPLFDTWMPPPRIADSELHAAAVQTFVGPDQEWLPSDFFYDHGREVGQLHVLTSAVGPGGSDEAGIGPGGDADCIKRLYQRCSTRTVGDITVNIHWSRPGRTPEIAVIGLGPSHYLEVVTWGDIPGFSVDEAVRFVTMDRWQTSWR
jgi:hypothetical protein